MHKLESAPAVSARTVLTIRSQSVPSVVITAEAQRANVDGKWQDDPSRMKQIVRFNAGDGPVELSGVVPEAEACDFGTQFEVRVLCECSTVGLPAFEAGKKGRSIAGVSIVGVLEVLDSSGKQLYAARMAPAAAPRVMDEKGKIR